MAIVSTIVNILAAVGLIVILSYAVYYMYQYIKKQQNQQITSQIYPPGDYMQSSGIQCPDYWVNTGLDSNGNYICKNSFNIPVNTSTNSLCNTSQMAFNPVNVPGAKTNYTWDYNNPNGNTSLSDSEKYNFLTVTANNAPLSRCDWVNNCGPASNIQGIWSGVNEICNSPAPIK